MVFPCTGVPVTPGPDVVGCYDFDGTFFPEGESWHPTLPGQGQVPCINCTCIVSGIIIIDYRYVCHSVCLSVCLSVYVRKGFCLMQWAIYLHHKEFTTLNHACPFMIHTSPLISIPSHRMVLHSVRNCPVPQCPHVDLMIL